MKPTLLLASRSPRRRKILNFLGVPFRVVKPSQVSERRLAGEPPRSYVRRLALEKARHVLKKFPSCWVIGADTVVVLDGKIFGKPADEAEASRMLSSLRGGSHWVLTGVALVGRKGRFAKTRVEKTRVSFKAFPTRELGRYFKSREPFDKAGGYDIQGTARSWIKGWKGDYFNVMGLPVEWLAGQLNRHVFGDD